MTAYRGELRDELDRFIGEALRREPSHSADVQEMWRQLGHACRGGKKLRSALLYASYESYGGQDADLVCQVGAALELLHTAFVIHDDVIDRDLIRRGSSNVSGVFAARARARGANEEGAVTLGVAAGVLAGDLALMRAVQQVALCGARQATTRQLLALVDDAVRVSAAGELDDVVTSVCRSATVTMEQVVAIAEHKTAWYSFRLPLQVGAILADAPQETVDQLAVVGRLTGIGFQLADDLRGVFGDESETGKSALSDLREGKMTALMAHARTTGAWDAIAVHIGDPTLTPAAAMAVRDLLSTYGSRRFVEDLAEDYLKQAVQTAEQAGIEPALLGKICRLTQRIMRSAAA